MIQDNVALLRLLQVSAVASNEAADIRSAAAICLDETRRVMNWPVGHLCLVSRDGQTVEPSGVWSLEDAVRYAPFKIASDAMTFPRGVGLPGRVLESGRAHWVVDAQRDPNFPRAPVAVSVGLHAGLAFPILTGTSVSGVMEFFASEVIPPHDSLLEILAQVGRQLGRVIERERAAESVRESETQFRSVAQSAADAIIVSDANGRISFCNHAAEQMFGHAQADLVGQPLTTLMPESFRGAHRQGIARMRNGEATRLVGKTVELVGLHRDGSEFPIELSLSSWTSQGERCFSGIIRDIRDRKAAEEKARHQEERLRHAAKMQAVGLLAGGIAHDFNNMLQSIHGCAGFLAPHVRHDPSMLENVVEIQDAVERAAGLTRHLLALSRRQVLKVTTVDVNALIESLQKMLARLLPESIAMDLVLADPLPPIRADHTQIEQVILNLAVNARDAMPAGGRLLIQTAIADPTGVYGQPEPAATGPHVLIAMTDTGVGMDAETRARIFEPFFTTKEGTGTGLGLSTVYGIVEQSGGAVSVVSEPGRGATFKLFFPIFSKTALPVWSSEDAGSV